MTMSEEQYPEELIIDGSVIQCDWCLEYYPKEDLSKVKDIHGEIGYSCDNCMA